MTARTSAQVPVGSGFSRESTAREVIAGRDLSGKVALVSGGGGGVGLETTRALAEAGATVLVGARRPDVARAALAGIPRVELSSLDLADPRSVETFVASVLSTARALHLLVNNAGIMAVPLYRDSRGFESHLATNHLGHFQLTARLWPALRRARGARVVVLSSRAHAYTAFDFEDPHFERRNYEKWLAYGQSKTANVLHAVELDRRGQEHGIRAFAVHPGAVRTELVRHVPDDELARLRAPRPGNPDFYKTPEQGAATSIWAATSPQLDGKGGLYLEDVDVAPAVAADTTGHAGVRPWAIDPDQAVRLWTMSEAWVSG